MLTQQEINDLGNILNHTWGTSSSRDGKSVTCNLHGNLLKLNFQTIVHFASDNSLHQQVGRLAEESVQVLTAALSETKKRFKEETGNALNVKETLNNDNIEMVSATVNSPRKIAYYRRNVIFEIQN